MTDAQYSIEHEVAQSPNTSAAVVYFVQNLPPQLYFRSANITFNKDSGVHTLNAFCFDVDGRLSMRERMPEGLLPEKIAFDPVQLAPILARAKSFEEMMRAGIPVTIITPNAGRERMDGKKGEVVPAQGALIERFRDRLHIVTISQNEYDWVKYNARKKERIPAASYVWEDKHDLARQAVIFDNPVKVPFSSAKTDKLFGPSADFYTDNLNGVLMNLGLPTLVEMASPDLNRPTLFRKPYRRPFVPGVSA